MKDTIYCVEVALCSDNSVTNNIYKLCKLGKDNPKYIWIVINENGGIGTGTNFQDWKDSIEDAFIYIHEYLEGTSKFIKGSLEESISVRDKFIERLNNIEK